MRRVWVHVPALAGGALSWAVAEWKGVVLFALGGIGYAIFDFLDDAL